jgi:hypothetical protein
MSLLVEKKFLPHHFFSNKAQGVHVFHFKKYSLNETGKPTKKLEQRAQKQGLELILAIKPTKLT